MRRELTWFLAGLAHLGDEYVTIEHTVGPRRGALDANETVLLAVVEPMAGTPCVDDLLQLIHLPISRIPRLQQTREYCTREMTGFT